MANSQNGWPVLEADSDLLHTWLIPTAKGTVKFRLRQGSAGFLLCHLALWYDQAIDPIIDPVLDDWGYAYRKIGDTSIWSDHASGTAIDIDALKRPQGTHTFTAAQKAAIKTRLGLYGNAIASGAFWSNVDEMHFSLAKPLADVQKVARNLMDSPRGRRVLDANPAQRAVILS